MGGYALVNRDRPDVQRHWGRYAQQVLLLVLMAVIAGSADYMWKARPGGLFVFVLMVVIAAAMLWVGRRSGEA